MGFKLVHIVFITLATILSGGFSVWCFSQRDTEGGGAYLLGGVLGSVFTISLVVYGIYFWRKIRRIIV